MRVDQQRCLALALETIAINLCFVQETKTHTSALLSDWYPQLVIPWSFIGAFLGNSRLRLLVFLALMWFSVRGLEAAPFDWIPVDSHLSAMRLTGSCRLNNRRSDRRKLSVVPAYAPRDCSPDVIKGTLRQKLPDLLRTARQDDVIIFAMEMKC